MSAPDPTGESRDAATTVPYDFNEFDEILSPPEAAAILAVSMPSPRTARARRYAGMAVSFLLGQGASQAIGVITGLYLVRRLSVLAYAQYGIATGFQSVFTILMDLGFAGTIVPLVGSRIDDRPLIGRYVRAARHLRDRTFLLLAPVASIAFLATIHKHGWSWPVQFALLASILLTLYSGGVVSFFSAPLLLFGKVRQYYAPQVFSSSVRLVLYGLLSLTGGLNAASAAGLGALAITFNGALVRRSGRKLLEWPRHDSREAEAELLKYVLPATPAIIFSAFQAQISLFLVSIFGSTLHTAEVTALGRIGALFTVMMSFHSVVIEPMIARLARQRLLRVYLGLIALMSLACGPVVYIAFRWPSVFLILLGPRFQGVLQPMGWYVLSSSLNFISGLIWIMNRGRKWVFWSGSILEVALLLTVQTAFVLIIGVRTTQQAVLFSLASSFCYLTAHIYVGIVGFQQKPVVGADESESLAGT